LLTSREGKEKEIKFRIKMKNLKKVPNIKTKNFNDQIVALCAP
jgi:hypothetical protein